MLKNTDGAKSKLRSKSTRKPLRDVSNAKISVNTANVLKKNSVDDGGQTGGDSLDLLLLVQSDLSSLVRQIDELVVQALQLTDNKGRNEIKRFADVLSDMRTSLQPWVPRLQKALCSQSTVLKNNSEQSIEKTVPCVPEENKHAVIESPVQTKWESLVSPSPLVSWRAECNKEGGRQLFLLTPLHQQRAFSSKRPPSSIPAALENVKTGNNTHPISAIDSPQTKCGTTDKFSKTNCSMFVMTPCLKMSPPKSCILLEPISEFTKKKTLRVHKSTPFPAGVRNFSESKESESSSSRSSDDVTVKYPELLGIKIANFDKRTVEEDSPDWIVSPPKTCVVMEPGDEKLLTNLSGGGLTQQDDMTAVKKVEYEDDHVTVANFHPFQGIRGTLGLSESTPMVKMTMSSFRMGKQPGENTLKKELWTKFEAASSDGICNNGPVLEDTTRKRFLDRLEEEALDS
ncbi:hypothetical protein OROGR_028924 [Orobanche gracilis]